MGRKIPSEINFKMHTSALTFKVWLWSRCSESYSSKVQSPKNHVHWLSALCSELHQHLLHSHRRGLRTPTPIYAPSHTWSGCSCAALQGGWFVCRRSTVSAVLSNTISSSTDAATAAKIDTPTKHELIKLQFTVTGDTTKAHRPVRYIKYI